MRKILVISAALLITLSVAGASSASLATDVKEDIFSDALSGPGLISECLEYGVDWDTGDTTAEAAAHNRSMHGTDDQRYDEADKYQGKSPLGFKERFHRLL